MLVWKGCEWRQRKRQYTETESSRRHNFHHQFQHQLETSKLDFLTGKGKHVAIILTNVSQPFFFMPAFPCHRCIFLPKDECLESRKAKKSSILQQFEDVSGCVNQLPSNSWCKFPQIYVRSCDVAIIWVEVEELSQKYKYHFGGFKHQEWWTMSFQGNKTQNTSSQHCPQLGWV